MIHFLDLKLASCSIARITEKAKKLFMTSALANIDVVYEWAFPDWVSLLAALKTGQSIVPQFCYWEPLKLLGYMPVVA